MGCAVQGAVVRIKEKCELQGTQGSYGGKWQTWSP